jgi:hypothetical protein
MEDFPFADVTIAYFLVLDPSNLTMLHDFIEIPANLFEKFGKDFSSKGFEGKLLQTDSARRRDLDGIDFFRFLEIFADINGIKVLNQQKNYFSQASPLESAPTHFTQPHHAWAHELIAHLVARPCGSPLSEGEPRDISRLGDTCCPLVASVEEHRICTEFDKIRIAAIIRTEFDEWNLLDVRNLFGHKLLESSTGNFLKKMDRKRRFS